MARSPMIPCLIALVPVLGFALPTFAQTSEGTPPAETAPVAETTPAADADTVVATVGGRDITLGEVIALRQSLPDQYQQLPDEILKNGLIDQLIDMSVLEAAAREAGIADSKSLALRLRNEERSLLANEYMRAELTARMTDEAVAARYKADYLDQPKTEEVHAAHILVAEKAKAEELKAALDGGADFAALAAENGTDGTASRGGDLGWFIHDDMVPEFADAVFAMQPGEISAPVESPFGWHLIKLEERRDREPPTIDEVRGELVEQLSEELAGEIMTELREKAEIARPTPGVAPGDIRRDALIAD